MVGQQPSVRSRGLVIGNTSPGSLELLILRAAMTLNLFNLNSQLKSVPHSVSGLCGMDWLCNVSYVLLQIHLFLKNLLEASVNFTGLNNKKMETINFIPHTHILHSTLMFIPFSPNYTLHYSRDSKRKFLLKNFLKHIFH